MRRLIIFIIVIVAGFYAVQYCSDRNKEKAILTENSKLIQEQISNVSKLIVTEGHFSQVFNYKKSKAIFGDFFTAEKKALVVVNADVTIAYDLSKIIYKIDQDSKTLFILKIPEEEIKIYPDLEYYDIQSDYFNPFETKDYNTIKNDVKASLQKKIDASDLKSNAKNRLISELSKLFVLTKSMGWTLKYNETPVETKSELKNLF